MLPRATNAKCNVRWVPRICRTWIQISCLCGKNKLFGILWGKQPTKSKDAVWENLRSHWKRELQDPMVCVSIHWEHMTRHQISGRVKLYRNKLQRATVVVSKVSCLWPVRSTHTTDWLYDEIPVDAGRRLSEIKTHFIVSVFNCIGLATKRYSSIYILTRGEFVSLWNNKFYLQYISFFGFNFCSPLSVGLKLFVQVL